MSMSTAGATGPMTGADAWEYLMHQVSTNELHLYDAKMKGYGADGWELVSALPLATGGGGKDAALTREILFLYKRRRR